jgi:arginyl-tRNA synthetase
MSSPQNNKDQLAAYFAQAVQSLLPADSPMPAVQIERPRMPEHGDFACNLAMQLAKMLKSNPREVANQLLEKVQVIDGGKLIAALEIAGPGFINIRLTSAAKMLVVNSIHSQAHCFGTNSRGIQQGVAKKVLVEFVSANPTGPLHVGHGRQGALGDAMSAVLSANGYAVSREFYYNDAGEQINKLALSVQARAKGFKPDEEGFPPEGYRGDYIADIAQSYLAKQSVSAEKVATVQGKGDVDDLNAIREFAVAYLRREQDLDLQAFGVKFDNYYLESSLYSSGRVEKAVAALVAAGKTFEEGGALWLRSTEYGDDKDRVMRKAEEKGGGYTYFVPDVAYHLAKYERGFEKAINVQGSDHHGTIARVRAGLQAVGAGIPKGFPDYVLHKMVTVMKGGEEVKISKRAGSYVTLRDLIEWSGGENPDNPVAGRDAVRFFFLSRKADTEFIFNVDLALSKSDENPVYYIQYAHARICSVLTQAGVNEQIDGLKTADLSPLIAPREFSLAARLGEYPEVIKSACDDLAPHAIAFYLKDLSADLHSYYNAERFLVDDEKLRAARLSLLVATRQVMRNGLALLGVSAPEKM